jgi:C1A family cysteine protease
MSRSIALVALVLLSLTLVAIADPAPRRNEVEEQYRSWASSKGKSHPDGSIEYDLAFVSFQHTLNLIAKHNATATGYTIGLTDLADETPDQLKHRLGINPDEIPEKGTYSIVNGVRVPGIVAQVHSSTPHTLATKIGKPSGCTATTAQTSSPGVVCDWRSAAGGVNVVSAVRNQAGCGSCWAFAANGALESLIRIKNVITTLQALSDQQLVSCSSPAYNSGCNGGWPANAWSYQKAKPGIAQLSKYAYTSGSGVTGTCKYTSSMAAAGVAVTGSVTLYGEDKLMTAINTIGPVVVAIQAGIGTFSSYVSGVYNDPLCGAKGVDHAVLVIGYGTETNGAKYWLIRNQWGTGWGMSGYMKMARGVNRCRIGDYPQYPLV